MASYIAQVNIGGTLYPVGSSLYGTCATEAATATKTATVNGFDTLTTGVTVFIKFTYANTSSTAAKLGINSTAAKEIHIKGKSTTSFDFSPCLLMIGFRAKQKSRYKTVRQNRGSGYPKFFVLAM